MKKILLISNMYPSKKHPHYGVFIKHTEDILKKEDFILKSIVLKKNDNSILKIFAYLNFYLKIIINLIFNKYEYVYVHYPSLSGLPILIVKRIKNFNLICNVHGNDLIPETKKDEKYIWITKRILNSSSKVVCPSTYFQTIVIEKYNIDPQKVFVFPSGGIDHSVFYAENNDFAKEKMRLDKKYDYIGFVSRLESGKGWEVFLEAVNKIEKEYENYKFIVVGSGTEEQEFNDLVRKLKLEKKVIKLGLQNQINLRHIYNSLDIFCFPTYRKSESLGLVGLEAMSCGKIIISTKGRGPSSYIKNGKNGFLVLERNSDELAEAIKKIIGLNTEKKKEMERLAVATSWEYDKNKLADILISIFN